MTNRPFHQSGFKRGGHFAGKKGKSFIRKNEKIKSKEVRVIDSDGQQLGVLQTAEAVAIAKKQGLDLVEISPNSNPPVCKILNFGKYKYIESKKSKGVPKQAAAKTKEVKFHVAIDPNDYNTKMRHAIEFLECGNKLKVSLVFRGREMAHTELGFTLIRKFLDDIRPYGTADSDPAIFGKVISATLSPCCKKQTRSPSEQPETLAKILDIGDLLGLE
jgi:translation initiation factor IF-3